MELYTLILLLTSVGHATASLTKRFLLDRFEQSECRHMQADILFMLDMSDDVTLPDFENEKAFVVDFIGHIDNTNQEYHVAVMTYSKSYHDNVDFDQHIDNSQLINTVKAIPKIPGERNLGTAMGHAGLRFYRTHGGRGYAAKILFLVTSGPDSGYSSRVDKYAAYLPSHYNVTIFVIGVTSKADVPEVRNIAQNYRHLFLVNDFSELRTLPDELLNTLCQDVIHKRNCFDSSTNCYRYDCIKDYYASRCPIHCGLCTPDPPTSPKVTTEYTTQQTTTPPQLPTTYTNTATSPRPISSSKTGLPPSTTQPLLTNPSSMSVVSTTSIQTPQITRTSVAVETTSSGVKQTTSKPAINTSNQCKGSDVICKDDQLAHCEQKQSLFRICSTSNEAVVQNCPVLCGLCEQYCQLQTGSSSVFRS